MGLMNIDNFIASMPFRLGTLFRIISRHFTVPPMLCAHYRRRLPLTTAEEPRFIHLVRR